MRIAFYLIVVIFSISNVSAQPNCEAYLYYKDTLKYEACKKTEEIVGHYQFSKAYQMILDEALEIDPTFAYAYNRKSVAYLKSGDFITWKKLTDKAVEYDPLEYLGHRGYIRYLCFRDYEGAIKDFNLMDSLGYRSDHIGMARALCYKSIGDHDRAVQILEAQMNSEGHSAGLHDYLHLGVIYLEQKAYEKALQSFARQSEENELAENQYYLALTYKALEKDRKSVEHLEKAKMLYEQGRRMFQDYIDPMHKVYLGDINDKLKAAANLGSLSDTGKG